ncbi:hypothetical protein QKW60_07790 [Defluviimonas aestuarii]|uniref:hypothetical protein n=1 Tax=Albidovulum aestuarii TaxID=1130726 RepID=UPI00249CB750|nr:hypothetical protein [Defluviimonas aestuarii]MDI3336304.1 hypothetical protein [Defluviimonas aestuarii]
MVIVGIALSGDFLISRRWLSVALPPSLLVSLLFGVFVYRFECKVARSKPPTPPLLFNQSFATAWVVFPILAAASMNAIVLVGVPFVSAKFVAQFSTIETNAEIGHCPAGAHLHSASIEGCITVPSYWSPFPLGPGRGLLASTAPQSLRIFAVGSDLGVFVLSVQRL